MDATEFLTELCSTIWISWVSCLSSSLLNCSLTSSYDILGLLWARVPKTSMFLLQTSSKEPAPCDQVTSLVTFLTSVTNTCEYSAGVKAEKKRRRECEASYHIAYTGRKQWEMNAHFLPFIQSRMPACGMVSPTLNEGLSYSFSHSGNTQNHTKVYFVAILNP